MVLAEQDAKGVLQDVRVRVRVHVLEIVLDVVLLVEEVARAVQVGVLDAVDVVVHAQQVVPVVVAVAAAAHVPDVPEIALLAAEDVQAVLVRAIQLVLAAEDAVLRVIQIAATLVGIHALCNVLEALRRLLLNIRRIGL